MAKSFDSEDPSVIGKLVLVGLTDYDDDGKIIRRQQWWGTILAWNMKDGLKVDLRNEGRPHSFPLLPDGLRPAEPGRYELVSTGEIIENPDYLYTLQSFNVGSKKEREFRKG